MPRPRKRGSDITADRAVTLLREICRAINIQSGEVYADIIAAELDRLRGDAPEIVCPACSATIRARMADAPPPGATADALAVLRSRLRPGDREHNRAIAAVTLNLVRLRGAIRHLSEGRADDLSQYGDSA